MITFVRTFLPALLALPVALPGSAQGVDISASAGFIRALDSLQKVTHAPYGAYLGVDYNGELSASELPVRVGLAYAAMPGKESHGLKTSLSLVQLHGDFFLDTPMKELRAVAGLSINKYSMYRDGSPTAHESADPLDVDHHYPVRSVSGIKLGYRLGVEYTFSKALAGEVLFQQTELAGKDFDTDSLARQGGVNPAWIQFGITYHF